MTPARATFPPPEAVPLVVAEIGGNHGGDVELAVRMIEAAVGAGCRAVKFQTYVTERLVARTDAAFAELERERLCADDFRVLADVCKRADMTFLSTPFDEVSADLLEALEVPAFKIASGDLTHLPLLRHVARKGRPMLVSVGAGTWEEIDTAVAVIRAAGDPPLVLLQCTAAYPCPDAGANLAAIPALARRYGVPVGFSDHTLGIEVALGAVALGAVLVEKHFTTDPTLPGGDNAMSIDPAALARLVSESRRVRVALGSGERRVDASEAPLRPLFRRGARAARDIVAGSPVTTDDVTFVRPQTGLSPAELDAALPARARRLISRGDPVTGQDLVRDR